MDDWAAFNPVAAPVSAPADPWAAFNPVNPNPVEATKTSVTAYGTGAAVASGLGHGLTSLAGLPGDLGDLLNRGIDKATSAVGITPAPLAPNTFGGENIQKFVEKNLTGEFHKPQNTTEQYAQTAASFVPGAVAAPAAGIGSIAGNALRYGIMPGLASEAAGQSTKGAWYEPYARVAGGLAASMVNPARLVTPNPISIERQTSINALPQGVQQNLTAGQRTGSEWLKNQESMAAVTPGSGGSVAQRAENVSKSFTEAALSRIGERADNVRPEVINRAYDRIGNKFEAASAGNNAVLGNQFGNDLVKVEKEYISNTAPGMRVPLIQETIKGIGEKAAAQGGILTGEQYQSIRSELGRRATGHSDNEVSSALFGIQHALDEAMARSIKATNPADIGKFEEARREYRNLQVIVKAATSAGNEGYLTPRALASAVKVEHGRSAYARGKGDFADLAHASEEILKPLPNSGTAQRQTVANMMGALGGAIGFHHGYDPGQAVLGGFLGRAAGQAVNSTANALINRGLLSNAGQSYLSNQLLNKAMAKSPDAKRLLQIQMLQRTTNQGSQ